MIIIPIKWLFHWEYTLFSDKPIYFGATINSTNVLMPRCVTVHGFHQHPSSAHLGITLWL